MNRNTHGENHTGGSCWHCLKTYDIGRWYQVLTYHRLIDIPKASGILVFWHNATNFVDCTRGHGKFSGKTISDCDREQSCIDNLSADVHHEYLEVSIV